MATSSELCQFAIKIALWQFGPTQYCNDPGWNVGTWNSMLNAYQFDCLGFVRAVVLGWKPDRNLLAGGIDYNQATGWPLTQLNEPYMLESCQEKSNNFAALYNHPFALLKMDGHVGLYVGDFTYDGMTFNACECTGNRSLTLVHPYAVTPSWVDTDGTRRNCKGGAGILGQWQWWGVFDQSGRYNPTYVYDGIGGGGVGAAPYAIAAILGSWWGESKINPGMWESQQQMSWDYIYSQSDPNKGGYGLAQWTNLAPNAMLLQDMINWLNQNGFAPDSGEGQIRYFIEKNAWYDKPGNYNHYDSLGDFLTTDETNLEHLVHDFLASHQGATEEQLAIAVPIRTQFAQDIYDYIQQHQGQSSDFWQWTAGNFVLSDAQAYANCMAVYWLLAAGIPVTPEDPNHGVTIPKPIWTWLRNPYFYKLRRF